MQIMYLVYDRQNLIGIFKDKAVAHHISLRYTYGYIHEIITDIDVEIVQTKLDKAKLFREDKIDGK